MVTFLMSILYKLHVKCAGSVPWFSGHFQHYKTQKTLLYKNKDHDPTPANWYKNNVQDGLVGISCFEVQDSFVYLLPVRRHIQVSRQEQEDRSVDLGGKSGSGCIDIGIKAYISDEGWNKKTENCEELEPRKWVLEERLRKQNKLNMNRE